jgi:hypothetical protein
MVPSLSPVSPLHSLSCQVSTQMELARVGIVLLVWSITFSHQVHGKCTMHDKEAIFRDCEKYFETEYPSVSPSYVTNCCKTVERVPNMDMVFVLKLCTKKEIGHMVVKKFVDLEDHCKLEWLLPPPAFSPPPSSTS